MDPRRQSDLNTSLLAAVENGDIPSLRSLAAEGASVNCRDDHNITPLSIAVFHGNLDMVKELLKLHASVNVSAPIQRLFNEFPLHIAANRGHKDIVELLLRHGAHPGLSDGTGRTPRERAVERAKIPFIRIPGVKASREDFCAIVEIFDAWEKHMQRLSEREAVLKRQAEDRARKEAFQKNLAVLRKKKAPRL